MQRPDEKKRALITATAARLFATRPFHKVRLEDIAAEAKVGKGTVYIYFDDKDDLYFSIIYEGFAQLVDQLREQLGPHSPRGRQNGDAGGTGDEHRFAPTQALRLIVTELVRFAFRHPHFFELMRTVGVVKGHSESDWNRKREEWTALVVDTIRRGNEAGAIRDPQPELTALFIGGMVRSAMIFSPKETTEADVRDQILRLLERGVFAPAAG